MPIAAILACALCFAQGPERTVMNASIVLLRQENVQKELKLTAQQKSAIQGGFKRLNDAFRAASQKRPKNQTEASKIRADLAKLESAFLKATLATLTDPQRTRLREVAFQFFGVFCIASPEIAKEIGLSEAQKNKITTAQKALIKTAQDLQKLRQDEVRRFPQPKDPNDRKAVDEYRKKIEAYAKSHAPGDKATMEAAKKRAEAQALAVLTPAQRTKWAAMQGKKFAVVVKT